MVKYSFNRNKAKSTINPDDWEEKFSDQIVSPNKGWAIFWKDKQIKPKRGTSDYYASYNAAIVALNRNISIFNYIQKHVAKEYYGVEYNSKEWKSLFHNDLYEKVHGKYSWETHKMEYPEGKATEEEEKLFQKAWKEKRKFDSFCHNVLKTILIPVWIESGKLKIMEV